MHSSPEQANATPAFVIRPGTPADAAALAQFGARTFFETFAADNTADDMAKHLASAWSPARQDLELRDPLLDTLLAVENLTLFPHVGSASQHTRNAMGQLVVDNLVAFAEGRPPKTPVPETPFKGW